MVFPSSTAQSAIELLQRLRLSDLILIMFARISALSAISALALAISGSAASVVSRQATCPSAMPVNLCCLTNFNVSTRSLVMLSYA